MHDAHSVEFDSTRRVALLLAQAEHGLGFLGCHRLPLRARLEAVLFGAADRPAAVDPTTYAVAYRLYSANHNEEINS